MQRVPSGDRDKGWQPPTLSLLDAVPGSGLGAFGNKARGLGRTCLWAKPRLLWISDFEVYTLVGKSKIPILGLLTS